MALRASTSRSDRDLAGAVVRWVKERPLAHVVDKAPVVENVERGS